jgi:hypothetical protein
MESKKLCFGFVFYEFTKGQAQLSNDIALAWRTLLLHLENYSQNTTTMQCSAIFYPIFRNWINHTHKLS